MSDENRRFRLERATCQEHAETFTLAELRELASQGHDIFYDGEPDIDAPGAMNDDGFFTAITTGDTCLRTTRAAMDRADEAGAYGRVPGIRRPPAARRVTWRITAGTAQPARTRARTLTRSRSRSRSRPRPQPLPSSCAAPAS
jgi:hypothetical protein